MAPCQEQPTLRGDDWKRACRLKEADALACKRLRCIAETLARATPLTQAAAESSARTASAWAGHRVRVGRTGPASALGARDRVGPRPRWAHASRWALRCRLAASALAAGDRVGPRPRWAHMAASSRARVRTDVGCRAFTPPGGALWRRLAGASGRWAIPPRLQLVPGQGIRAGSPIPIAQNP